MHRGPTDIPTTRHDRYRPFTSQEHSENQRISTPSTYEQTTYHRTDPELSNPQAASQNVIIMTATSNHITVANYATVWQYLKEGSGHDNKKMK